MCAPLGLAKLQWPALAANNCTMGTGHLAVTTRSSALPERAAISPDPGQVRLADRRIERIQLFRGPGREGVVAGEGHDP
eukprot:11974760-Alexandrium_andersonii.AAC.1